MIERFNTSERVRTLPVSSDVVVTGWTAWVDVRGGVAVQVVGQFIS
jgi:hypothetical protein